MGGNVFWPKLTQKRTPRRCLKCNEQFDSTGKGNRLCAPCNAKNQTVATGCKRFTKQGDGAFIATEAE